MHPRCICCCLCWVIYANYFVLFGEFMELLPKSGRNQLSNTQSIPAEQENISHRNDCFSHVNIGKDSHYGDVCLRANASPGNNR